jgi:hypothetical protein
MVFGVLVAFSVVSITFRFFFDGLLFLLTL